MQCPRCQNATLDEIDRSGVTLDRCTSCRGIWLDRGELEKLIARATAELEGTPQAGAAPPYPAPPQYPAPQARYDHHDREPPSSRRGHHGHHQGHKRRSFWHDLLD